MCQLTFINTGHAFSNKLFTINQALVNTWTEHKDGFGVFANGKIYRNPKQPWDITNFSDFINPIINNNPVILHVRKSSFAYKDKKVDLEHTHPFETEHLVLAHNGTLEEDKTVVNPLYAEMIDSQIFLSELENAYVKDADIVRALNVTMKKFTGKFAFLIYEKPTGNFFAARGDIATLHHFPITIYDKNKEIISQGYIINTEQASLLNGLIQFANLLYVNKLSMNGNLPSKEITALPDNSIFFLGIDKIEKIGELKENKKVCNTYTTGRSTVYNADDETEDWLKYATRANNRTVPIDETPRYYYRRLIDFCGRWLVTIPYLDIICWRVNGKSLVCLDEGEFKYFIECLTYMDKFLSTDIVKLWFRIKKVNSYDLDIHNRFNDLEFPYMLNDNNRLKEACEIYEKERDKTRISGV